MKTLLSVVYLVIAFASPIHAESDATSELTRLRREFEQRRTTALRETTAWYRGQLEALQLKASGESHPVQDAIASALAVARETYWQDDQPELTAALSSGPWLWRSVDDSEGVETTFRSDGTVEHIGLHGRWRITGPNEVTIEANPQEKFVLRFNASLTAYEGDRLKVSGQRLPVAP